MAGLGTLLAWFFTYFVLGPLIVLLPIKAGTKSNAEVDLQAVSPFALRQTERLISARKPILAAFGIIAAVTIMLAAQTKVNSRPV